MRGKIMRSTGPDVHTGMVRIEIEVAYRDIVMAPGLYSRGDEVDITRVPIRHMVEPPVPTPHEVENDILANERDALDMS